MCIVGGPRPSPEGVLCYKNVMNDPNSSKPLSEKLEIDLFFKFYENGRSVHNTPTPRRATARDSETTSKSSARKRLDFLVKQESDPEPIPSDGFPAFPDTGRSVSSVDEMKAYNEHLDKLIEEPMEVPVQQIQVQKPIEESRPLTSVYKIPFDEMKLANFPRSVHSLFARESFLSLNDRHGNPAQTEDATLKSIVDMNREQMDRLDVSHVYFQFVAFKQ